RARMGTIERRRIVVQISKSSFARMLEGSSKAARKQLEGRSNLELENAGQILSWEIRRRRPLMVFPGFPRREAYRGSRAASSIHCPDAVAPRCFASHRRTNSLSSRTFGGLTPCAPARL